MQSPVVLGRRTAERRGGNGGASAGMAVPSTGGRRVGVWAVGGSTQGFACVFMNASEALQSHSREEKGEA